MNTELKIDIEYFFNNHVFISSSNCLSKWKPILSKKFLLDDDSVYTKICDFLERYSELDKHIKLLSSHYNFNSPLSSPISSLPQLSSQQELPSWYIELPDVIERFNRIFEEANFTRLSIIREYYNILSNKKGIELDGGILIEEGNIIKNKSYYSIISKIEDMIDDEIKYLTNLEYRKVALRKDKLNSL